MELVQKFEKEILVFTTQITVRSIISKIKRILTKISQDLRKELEDQRSTNQQLQISIQQKEEILLNINVQHEQQLKDSNDANQKEIIRQLHEQQVRFDRILHEVRKYLVVNPANPANPPPNPAVPQPVPQVPAENAAFFNKVLCWKGGDNIVVEAQGNPVVPVPAPIEPFVGGGGVSQVLEQTILDISLRLEQSQTQYTVDIKEWQEKV